MIEIDYVIADDPIGAYDFYSPGDTLTIVFSEATNMAGLPATSIPKSQIDALLRFSEPIGADYVGNWRCGSATSKLCKEVEVASDSSGKVNSFWFVVCFIVSVSITSLLSTSPRFMISYHIPNYSILSDFFQLSSLILCVLYQFSSDRSATPLYYWVCRK